MSHAGWYTIDIVVAAKRYPSLYKSRVKVALLCGFEVGQHDSTAASLTVSYFYYF